ncbi:hypothetical protein [Variovorax sp. Varisp36]|uniref:hypothetical protein n=1 Tax=Variovorax sp. Varisp36 TaxID=3243031 RepID=UPI0039A63451
MTMLQHVQAWIQHARAVAGPSFDDGPVPVALFDAFDVDDIGFPFRNIPVRSWLLHEGTWVDTSARALSGVPYAAFCIDVQTRKARIQYGWAARYGAGLEVQFDSEGVATSEKMAWIS